jgi:hypothetical protein
LITQLAILMRAGLSRSWSAFLVVTLAAILLVACGAGATAPPSASASPPPATNTPRATEAPTLEPTPDPWLSWNERLDLLLQDDQFARDSRDTCLVTRPADLETLTGPDRPLDQAPTYRTVQMLLAEVVGPDGSISDLPEMDEYLWQGYTRTFRDGAVVADPDDVELLACVALRTGASRDYVANGISHTVYKTAEVVWMVERTSGEVVGRPWVIGASYAASDEFPSFLLADATLLVGGLGLLPAEFRTGELGEATAESIVAFLGPAPSP